MQRTIENNSDYRDKLLKLIPAEIVGAFLAIQGIVESQFDIRRNVLIFATIALFVMTPVYLRYVFSVTNRLQLFVSAVSFLIWVFSIGGPFLSWEWYVPAYGSVALILWTLIIPVLRYDY